MLAQKEKLNKIIEAINSEAEKQRILIEKEIEERCSSKLKEAEDNVIKDSFILLQRRSAAIREDTGRLISVKINESKKELILHRNQLTNRVFDLVRNRLIDYKKTEAYKNYLADSIENALKHLGGFSAVYACKNDLDFFDFIEEISAIKPITDETIKIGGLRFLNKEGTLALDATLDSKLEAQYSYFTENCGMTFNPIKEN